MNATTVTLRGLIVIMVVMLMMPATIRAQVDGGSEQATTFSKEELTQMLAPIALYPDSLTAQILMASTYPLEVVEAERWLRQQQDLKGDDLDKALKEKPWDPSVKSLCHTPDVLIALSEKLDQTRKLGDAFLGQEKEVMATIQELRRKAKEQGNLTTTKEQRVIVEEEFIKIEPADPEIVYVPVYNPYYVYGPWWYPAYPPYYWYYPPGIVTGAYIGFGPSFYVGFGFSSWAWFNWPYYSVNVNYYHTRHYHHHHGHYRGEHAWNHDTFHRKGVAYRDRRTGERYGARPPRTTTTRPETRGYPSSRVEGRSGGRNQGTREPGGRTVDPRQGQTRETPRGTVERRERSENQRLRTGTERAQPPVRRDTPFRGIGEGSFESRAGERGRTSTRGSEAKPVWDGIRGGELRPQWGGSDGGRMRPQGGGSRGGGQGGGSRGGGQGGGSRGR